MEFETSYITLWHLTIALGLGLIIGLERERAGKEVGLRTFSFVALLGFLTWHMGQTYAIASLAMIGVVVIVINVRSILSDSGVEATTSVALFLINVVGMMMAQGAVVFAVSVVVLMLALLSYKEEMVLFTNHLQKSELHAAITLGILSFVILPVLPVGALDPWGLFDIRKIWLMVVLISAIGFGNYILLKLYGSKGINYTGFLGGLVNSTATVAELSQKARVEGLGLDNSVFRGIMWAKTAAFLRNGVILAIFAPTALPAGLVPVGLMLAVTLYLALRGSRSRSEAPPEINLESPFSLKSALTFGWLFALITVFGSLAGQLLGNLGFYVVSFFGGIVSSSSTAATAAHLVTSGHITPLVAGSAVIISSIASAFVILPVVWKGSGRPLLVRRVATAIGWVMLAAAIGIAVNPYFLAQYRIVEALVMK